MKYSLTAPILVIFVMCLINSCSASEDKTKQDGDDYESLLTSLISEGSDVISERVEGKQMHQDGGTFLESQQSSTDLNEALSKFRDDAEEDDDWTEDDGDLEDQNNEDLSVTHEGSNRHRRHCKSRRRKNRKRKEIKRLHEELSQVAEHVEEISEKESELEHEIDELRQRTLIKDKRKQKHTKSNKQLLEIQMPHAKEDKHRSIESEIEKKLPGHILDSSDVLGDSIDERRYSTNQEGRGQVLLEELRDLRKQFRKVLSENQKLRAKNSELCKQLYETLSPQGDRKYDGASILNGEVSTSLTCDTVLNEEVIVQPRKRSRKRKNRNKMSDKQDEMESKLGEKEMVVIDLNSDVHQKHENSGKTVSQSNIEDSGTYHEGKANSGIMRTDKEEIAAMFTVEDKQKVYDHIASVDEATFCDKPQPVVVYPADQYPVPNKRYTPQGTILHRCGSHSGCCPNEQLTCVPAKKEVVTLHFFAAVLDGSSSIFPHIEKLEFTNHTKCGCVFKHHAHRYL